MKYFSTNLKTWAAIVALFAAFFFAPFSAMADTGPQLVEAIKVYGRGHGTGGVLQATWDAGSSTVTVTNANGTPITEATATLTLDVDEGVKIAWKASLTGNTSGNNNPLLRIIGDGVAFEITDNGRIMQTSSTSGSRAIFANGENFAFTVNGGALTSYSSGIVLSGDNSSVVVNGGSVTASTNAIILSGDNSSLAVNGGTISGSSGGNYLISINGDNSSFTISSGTVSANSSYALYFNGSGSVTVSGGELSANSNAIYASGAITINVSGGTVSTTTGTAIYANSTNSVVNIGGAAEVKATSTGSSGTAISAEGNVNMTGGTVSAIGYRAIYASGTNSVVNVSGGTVSAATGTAISATGANSEISISGAVEVKVTGTTTNTYPTAISSSGKVYINGGTVSGTIYRTINATSASSIVNVSGGEVSTTTGTAIYVQDVNGRVTIDGAAEVKATADEGRAIYINGKVYINGGAVSALGGTNGMAISLDNNGFVQIAGGTVSATGNRTINAAGNSVIYITGGTVSAPNGTQMLIYGQALSIVNTGTATQYTEDSSDDLAVAPAGATAVWSVQGLEHGIKYANGSNIGFMLIEGVTVIRAPVSTFPLSESFDNTAFPPLHWWTTGTSTTYGIWRRVTSGSSPSCSPRSGAGMVQFYSAGYGTYRTERGWLITPEMNPQGKALKLSFWMYRENGQETFLDRINIRLGETMETADAVLLATYYRHRNREPVAAANGWYQYSINLPTTSMTSAYIFIEGITGVGGLNIHLDDISITDMSDVVDGEVTAIVAPPEGSNSNMTNSEQVTVQVKNKGGVALQGFQLKLEVNDELKATETYSGAPIVATLTGEYTFTQKLDLSGEGLYNIKVTIVVPDDVDETNNSKTITVASCIPVASFPWAESFDGAQFPPPCWFSQSNPSTAVWTRVTAGQYPAVTPHSGAGTGMLQFSRSYATGQRGWIVSPEINTQDKGLRLSFWMYRDTGSQDNLDRVNVYLSETTEIENADLLLTVHRSTIQTPTASVGWRQYFVNLPSASMEKARIIFEAVAVYGNSMIYLDDISIEQVSVDAEIAAIVTPPVGNNDNLTNSEQVKALVKNNGSSALSGFELTLELDGEEMATETYSGAAIPVGGQIEYTFAQRLNLSAAATFQIKVTITAEDDEDATNNSKTTTISNCSPIATFPWTESFEGPIFPTGCWISDAEPSTAVWRRVTSGTYPTLSAPYSGTRMLQFNSYNYSSRQSGWLISPEINPQGKTLKLSFWMYRENNSATYLDRVNVYVSETPEKTDDAVPLATFYRSRTQAPAEAANGWYEQSVNLPTASMTSAYFIIEGVSGGGYNIYLDDVSLTDASNIIDGAITAITAPAAGTNSNMTDSEKVTVKIRNESGAPLKDFQLKLELDGEEIATETYAGDPIPFTEEVEYTFNATLDLSSGGTYQIRVTLIAENDVNADNDVRNVSLRNCAMITAFPFEENFSVFPLICWTTMNSGQNWVGNANGTINTLGSSLGSCNLITPQLSIPDDGDYLLEFRSMANVSYSAYFNVLAISDPETWGESSPAIRLKELGGSEINVGWKKLRVSLSEFAGQEIYLVFAFTNGSSGGNQYWSIDDVSVYDFSKYIDGELVSILLPTAGINVNLSDSEPVKVLVKNDGGVPLSAFDLKLELNGEEIATETYAGAPIPAGETIEYLFTQTLDFSEVGAYEIKVSFVLETDRDASNNSKTVALTNMSCELISEFPWTESFDDTTFPPSCWVRGWTGPYSNTYWNRVTSGSPAGNPHSGAGMLQFHCGYYDPGTASWLITPPVSTKDKDLFLSFWMFKYSYSPSYLDRVNIYVNETASREGATLLATFHRSTTQTPVETQNGWYNYYVQLPVSELISAHVIIEAVSARGDAIYLDDVSIVVGSVVPPQIRTASLPEVLTGFTYNQILVAESSLPVTWTLEEGSSLPAGLELSEAGVISGKPTVSGNFNFTVAATNDVGSNSVRLSIRVNSFTPVTDVAEVPERALVDKPYTLTGSVSPSYATNQTIVWSVQSGAATISDENIFTATAKGTVTITATIEDGKGEGENFTKEFAVEIISPFDSGSGSEEFPYLISRAGQLDSVRYSPDSHFKLLNNIDLSAYLSSGGAGYEQWGDKGWMPIGDYSWNNSNGASFSGSFNGDGKKITGLWINRSDRNSSEGTGLFGTTYNAKFSNLGVEISEAGVIGNWAVGGLVGQNQSSSVINCYTAGNVNGNGSVGGLIGYNYNRDELSCPVENCHATGNINGTGTYTGGLVGQNNSNIPITNSYATGNVTAFGNSYVGGLVGENSSNSPITNCYATGNVTGGSMVGGLVGQNSLNALITNCYATGNVTGGNSVGGLTGSNQGRVEYSYASGYVLGAGTGYVGGLLGFNLYSYNEGGTIINCVASNVAVAVTVTQTRVNRVIGSYIFSNSSGSFISNSYANADMIVNDEVISGYEGIDKDLATLATQAFYTNDTNWDDQGWDFSDVWQIWESKSFPYYQWQSAPMNILSESATAISYELRNNAEKVVVSGFRNGGPATLSGVTTGSHTVQLSSLTSFVAGDTLKFTVWESGKAASYTVQVVTDLIFVAVTNISGVPVSATASEPLQLTGTVEPQIATNKTIVWSVKSQGDTGATITGGNLFNATAEGTAIVTATIANGATEGTDYEQDFEIVVTKTAHEKVPVTFSVTVPDGTPADAVIRIAGTFAASGYPEWEPDGEGMELTKGGDGKYSITLNLIEGAIEYKYVLNGNWDYVEMAAAETGSGCASDIDDRSRTIEGAATFDDIVANWRLYTTCLKHQVTFSVTVPEGTPNNAVVRIAGDFADSGYPVWAEAGEGMELIKGGDGKYSITLDLYAGPILYKYVANGNWDYVEMATAEAGSECASDIADRSRTIVGAATFGDIVENWKGITTCISDITTYAVTVINGTGSGNFAAGASVTITANTPPDGKQFKEWNITPSVTFINGTSAILPTAVFTMLAQDVSATAVYEDIQLVNYAINVTVEGSGTAGANVQSAPVGTQITLTATANNGNRFVEWVVVSGGVTLSSNTTTSATFTMPENEVEIKAVFEEIPTYTVTVTNGTGGGNFAAGATIAIVADAAPEGKQFKEWEITPSVDFTSGTSAILPTAAFTMPAQDVTATAVYEDIQSGYYPITVTVEGNGIANASAQSAPVDTEITLTATANTGNRFVEWVVISGGITLSSNTATIATFTMPENAVEIKAVFEEIPAYSITVTVEGNGTANASVQLATAGTEITLTATANTGNRFVEWVVVSGGITLSSNTATTAIFTMPDNAVEIKAVFEAIPATVTSVTVSPGATTVEKGKTQTFVATVSGTNNPAQTVIWTVEGVVSGTTITSAGILTVAANETAETLTVRATSTVDNTKSGTATVTVITPLPQGTCTVEGTITNAPAGTTVYLYALESSLTKSDAPDGYVLVAVTQVDANGNYSFEGLPEGTYIVVVAIDGYESASSAPIELVGASSSGSADFTVDPESNTITATSTSAPFITTTSLPNGKKGIAYSETLTADSETSVGWSITNGTLPAGLVLNTTSGLISGTPTATGTSTFTVKATNAGGDATKQLSITIDPPAPVITTASLPNGKKGEAYSQTLTADSETPVTWGIEGTLPAGLTLNATTGLISGTPTATGTSTFTVKATNAGGEATKQLSITIDAVTDAFHPQLANPLKAWMRNGLLHVTGLTVGESLNVYTVTGMLIHQSIAASEEADIKLDAQGVYIVQQGKYTIRVVFN